MLPLWGFLSIVLFFYINIIPRGLFQAMRLRAWRRKYVLMQVNKTHGDGIDLIRIKQADGVSIRE